MIIFLYGPDSYRLRQYAQGLQDRYVAKYPSGLNLINIDGTQPGWVEQVSDTARNVSFFDEVRLAIIRQPFHQKNSAEALAALVADQDLVQRKDIVVMAIEYRPGKELKTTHKGLFELLNRKGNTIQEFEHLSAAALITWVRQEIQRQDSAIADNAITALIERVGPDTWSLSREIEKLVNYRFGDTVLKEDVAALISSSQDANIFNLIDAFANKHQPSFYELLYREFHGGRDPYYVLTMLVYQTRNLLAVKNLAARNYSADDIAKTLSLHPFVVRKTLAQARKFQPNDLQQLFSRLADLELGTKQGVLHLDDQLFLILS